MPKDKGSRVLVARVMAETLAYSSGVLIDHARGRLNDARIDGWLDRWSRHIYTTAKLSLDVMGTEHIDANASYVVMSNHASLVDVPSVVRAFPGRLRFVAKRELAEVPLFGPAMSHAAIVVDRGDRKAAIGALKTAQDRIKNGISLWVAPEGTRSIDGRLGAFKKGGFHVAKDLQLPILPTWVEGARDVLVSKSMRAFAGKTVHVTFGQPISASVVEKSSVDELMHVVRTTLLSLAARHNGPAKTQQDDEARASR